MNETEALAVAGAYGGVVYLGLPWLSRRGSSFIWGVWHDAKYLADQIEIQRKYRDYEPDHNALLDRAVS